MKSYSVFTDVEKVKNAVVSFCKSTTRAKLTSISDCGSGYYITLDTDDFTAGLINDLIDRNL